MGLNGVEIILNSSASHAELRKLNTRLNLIQNCTRKLGGAYVYANATGVGACLPPPFKSSHVLGDKAHSDRRGGANDV